MSVPTPAAGALQFAEQRSTAPTDPSRRAAILANPGFVKYFTDHMISATWSPERGWHDGRLEPYGPITLDPTAAVLHYAQEIYEGLKAYRHADGSVWTFRPELNAARLARSARRMALPELPAEDFLGSLELLVRTDADWVPSGEETSLYLRPFMFASDPYIGLRPAHEVRYLVIASPVGSYFANGSKPVSIWLSTQYSRAARGGTGAAKCGGNYAASLVALREAGEHGCDQVCFIDVVEQRWIEELGGMNIFFVYADGRLVTPALSGTILEGVTRASLLVLAEEQGLKVEERRVAIDEWRDGVASGQITEVFACGTAAVVTAIGRLVWQGGEVGDVTAPAGEVTTRLRRALVDIQYGRAPDTRGWLRRLA